MADHNPNPWQQSPAPEAVAASTGAATWTVEKKAAVSELVAPSIVVSATPTAVEPVGPRVELLLYRMNMTAGRHRRHARAS
jgi:hypothetical protein